MDPDDPRIPLLGAPEPSRLRRAARKLCGARAWRRRLPVTIWLPKYNLECLLRDAIAGITVGLTSIPQGIAYAMVAGVPPQVGLYSSIFPGYVYMLLGSCKDVTVGPTAILAALLAKYVAHSVDFAYLAAFLSGCVILLLGVLQLGFLLDFISKPVISAFTTAAALQIAAAQLKSLFRVSGSSGDTFINALINFFKNIKTARLWDPILGIASIAALVLLKKSTIKTSPTDPRWRLKMAGAWLYMVRARNALVVFVGAILASVLYARGISPFALTGKIEGGLPAFGPPPFSTTVNNATVPFEGMLAVFGAEGLVMPLVAILESIAIAKAFAGTSQVDATQEMIAVGACNLLASFAQGMPATGSFTRTALNHACGVMTPAGSFFKATLVLLAVTVLARALAFIPRSTLAAVITVAMVSIIDPQTPRSLWTHRKPELFVYLVTLVVGCGAGLEYGIAAGAAADAGRALCRARRPDLAEYAFKVGHTSCVRVCLWGALSGTGADRVRRVLSRATQPVVVVDCTHLHDMDLAVAESLISATLELEARQQRVLIWNLPERQRRMCEDLQPGMGGRCVAGPSIDQHVLGLDIGRR